MSILNAQARLTLQRWFEDPDTWVGVFENQFPGSDGFGGRVALPYDKVDYAKAALGDRICDSSTRSDWRYVLIAKCTSYEAVLAALEQDEVTRETYTTSGLLAYRLK